MKINHPFDRDRASPFFAEASSTQPSGASQTRNHRRIGHWLQRCLDGATRLHALFALAAPIVDLAVRLWVGGAFFRAGLTKIQSFDTTLLLFENEYAVPLLPPGVAAVLGTAAELALPVFLVVGLGGRLAAAALFLFNLVAVVSFPELMGAGLEQHKVWGLLLLVTMVHGPGRLSLDAWIARRRAPAQLED